jgi:MFS family permease
MFAELRESLSLRATSETRRRLTAMRVPGREWGRVLWNLLNAASITAWLISLGVGGLVTTALGWFASFESEWQWPFWVSLFVLITGVTLAALTFRFPALAPTDPAVGDRGSSRGDWVDPEELRAYLKSIKQTMEEEGFGAPSSPNASLVEPAENRDPTPAATSADEERAALLVSGHSVLAEMAMPVMAVRQVVQGTMGFPDALRFVRDGQTFLARYESGLADASLIARYQDADEAREAIRSTLHALSRAEPKSPRPSA